MKIQEVILLFEYDYWANRKLLGASTKLSQDQFAAPSNFPHHSLRGTFVHILDAEYGWRMLCESGIETKDLTEAEFPTVEALEKRWREEETAMRSYLSALKDDDLSGIIRYTTLNGIKRERILWQCLFHVVNHGTQHRSEAAAILTDFNQSPGDFDFSMFTLEKKNN